MSSEIDSALGVTNTPRPKVSIFDVEPNKKPTKIGDNIAEAVLAFVAYTILILGIIGSVICGIAVGSGYDGNTAAGWGIFIGGVISSLITWAVCMVVINISNNIRIIKHKLLSDLK